MCGKVILPLLLTILLIPPCTVAKTQPDSHACNTVEFPSTEHETRASYTISPNMLLVTDLYAAADSSNDYGKRLMLYKQEGATLKLVYYSSGSADSYILRPTFYQHCAGYELLILAEMGTEYSWGARVFAYLHGKVTDLGEIPLALETNDENDNDSIIPYTDIREEKGTFVITFRRTVVKDGGEEDEKIYPPGKIKYLLRQDRLLEVNG